jgi:glyoxylase I family protein
MQLPNPDTASMRPDHGGRIAIIALPVTQLAPLKARLDAAYTPSRDPDGNTLEFIEGFRLVDK